MDWRTPVHKPETEITTYLHLHGAFGDINGVYPAPVQEHVIHVVICTLILQNQRIEQREKCHSGTLSFSEGMGEKVGYTFVDRVLHIAACAKENPLKDLEFVLFGYSKGEIAFTDRAAEDIQELAPHVNSSLKSMIWESSGPVDIRVTGQPISSSAFVINSFAFFVSFAYPVTPKHALSTRSIPVIAA